jgi:diaminohydroxyphosphoribosylaminopyrimidine deaminase / 5-amino-6-(5-phosphoribosylamino)uracil reductase
MHNQFMQRCLQLAKMGMGNVAPNPMVGCVIVHNGMVIGEGYHKQYGEAHAEVNAIESVNDKSILKEATLYVNLEPCAHHGKTPPCSDLIIEKKIKHVVIGCKDPFEKVNGAGTQRLRDAGIEVTENILMKECAELNKRFFTFHQKQRPYIILKWAQSADGFIAAEKPTAENRWISNKHSQKLVHKWRSEEAGILIGVNTAVIDNPKLDVRLWKGNNPLRILIDRDLKTPSSNYLLTDLSPTLVFNSLREEDGFVKYLKIDFNQNVLQQVLKKLFDLKIQSVIVEGGGATLSHFINENLWDEARVFESTEKYLHTGITAPSLNCLPEKTDSVVKDRLLLFKNHR